MSIFKKIKSFEFDRNANRILGIKSAILWGHNTDTNRAFPLLYISKPKHISDEEYKELIDHIEIQFVK